MANIIQHLTSVSLDSRSGSPPNRRSLALVLVGMLVFGSIVPGFALAGEGDSEGEGTAPPVEVPVDPGFDPGGEEEALEEAPAAGGDEETGAVEIEAEVDPEVPAAGELTSATAEAPAEAVPPSPTPSSEPATSAPAPEPIQQQATEPTEPVANQSIVAPKQKRVERRTASESAALGEAPPAEPVQQDAPPPQPATAPPAELGRGLAGKDTYVVRPGDCLWHIAADLLPANAGSEAVEAEVERLWRLNEDRIGTGDPSLIYAGTELRLR